MKEGDRVKALFTDGKYYKAEVLKVLKKTLKVTDGNDTWTVKIEDTKPIKKKKKAKKIVEDSPDVEPPAFDVSDFFDIEEKETRLNSITIASTIDPTTLISTGVLALDLVIGGGLKAGRWYDFVGPESSGKTTSLYHCFSSALNFIPNTMKGLFLDIEGLIDPVWFSNICGKEADEVFGVKADDGSWITKPQIRYYKPAFGERGLQFIKKALKRMPDKVQLSDTWYYMFSPSTAKNVKKAGGYGTRDLQSMLKGKYSKPLFSKTGNFYVEIPNNYGGPELIIGIDSWASMTPEAIAEDDSNALGGQARMFSKYLNDIKSLISSKGCTIIGLNQVREKPMAFGDPEYSPGGSALKHACDCRVRLGAVANQNGKGPVEHEDGDSYRWCKVRIKKNKIFIPFKECRLRWWTEHDGDSGYGADIVQDTLEYLTMTGQLKGSKRGFFINIKKLKSKKITKLNDMEWTYSNFKDAILNPKDFGIDIRSICKRQMIKGLGVPLYLSADLE